jgi:class 3 adenylate cyclase/DNA-binding response OmpR family regulator/predicted ATPase
MAFQVPKLGEPVTRNTMRPRVLLLAEDVDLRARIARELHSSGFAVELASDDERALELAAKSSFLKAIVALGAGAANLPTALSLSDAAQQVLVLAERADDLALLHHSFPGMEVLLLDRSNEEAVVKRIGEIVKLAGRGRDAASPLSKILRIGSCTVNLAGHVLVDAAGRETSLTRAEAELLQELASHPREILSRERLRHAVTHRGRNRFDESVEPFDRSIDMLVARLRRKIEPDAKAPQFLLTVPGVGYKLIARPISDAESSQAKPGEPERRQITALCCSLVGAMEFALGFDPEDLSRISRSFHDAAAAAVTRLGGTIAYVTPDQILAIFGYPGAHEDGAERAVKAGLDALANVGEIISPRGDALRSRVGIATGLALASPTEIVGGPSAIATAVCAVAPPDAVLVTASTHRRLSSAFACDKLEEYPLAGLNVSVTACRVTAKREVKSRFRATRSKKVVQLVGRARELQELIALWQRAKGGRGQVALISGEPGIGKSHLCEFLLEQLTEQRHLTLRYQCSPHHVNSPFYPVISHLEHAMGFEPSDTAEIKLKKLKGTLLQAGKVTQEDVYLYARLLSVPTPEPASLRGLTPQRQKDLTIAAMIRHLQGVSHKQPLVIVLADAHWIDSSTNELVGRIISLLRTAHTLLLIEFRPEFTPQWLGDGHVTVLHLERLGREQSLAIIRQETGGKKLPQEVEDQITDKADGVPLFIEELTKTILESGSIDEAANEYVANAPLESLTVPTSLLDSLTARLDRIGTARDVAQIGAVIGREFSGALLAAVAPESASSLQASLVRLTDSGLVSAAGSFPDETYTFKHALVRDAAYETLPRAKRQSLHRRIAETLEHSFRFTAETQPELLAHHLLQAGLVTRTVEYLQRAGRRAIERSANAEAIAHLMRALELLRSSDDTQHKNARFRLEALLSQAMIARYGYAAQKTRDVLLHASTLIEETTEPSDKFAVLYGLWASHYVGGEAAKQRSSAAEFLAAAERTGDPATRCVGHRIVGTTQLTMGEFPDALRHLKQARALHDSTRHTGYRHQYGQDIGASTLSYLSWALWHAGLFEQASRTADDAIALAETLPHPHTLVYTICHARGFMDLFQRRFQGMRDYAGLVVSVCIDNGLLHWANCGAIFNAWATVCEGDADRGIQLLNDGLAAWQQGGARLWMPMFLMLQAQAYAKAARPEASLRSIDQAIASCENSGERWAMAEVLRSKAALLSHAGAAKRGEVEAILLASLDLARLQGARSWELRASCDLSRLWQRQRRDKEAYKLLQSVYDQFTEGFDTPDLHDARNLLLNLRRKTAKAARSDAGPPRSARFGKRSRPRSSARRSDHSRN